MRHLILHIHAQSIFHLVFLNRAYGNNGHNVTGKAAYYKPCDTDQQKSSPKRFRNLLSHHFQ